MPAFVSNIVAAVPGLAAARVVVNSVVAGSTIVAFTIAPIPAGESGPAAGAAMQSLQQQAATPNSLFNQGAITGQTVPGSFSFAGVAPPDSGSSSPNLALILGLTLGLGLGLILLIALGAFFYFRSEKKREADEAAFIADEAAREKANTVGLIDEHGDVIAMVPIHGAVGGVHSPGHYRVTLDVSPHHEIDVEPRDVRFTYTQDDDTVADDIGGHGWISGVHDDIAPSAQPAPAAPVVIHLSPIAAEPELRASGSEAILDDSEAQPSAAVEVDAAAATATTAAADDVVVDMSNDDDLSVADDAATADDVVVDMSNDDDLAAAAASSSDGAAGVAPSVADLSTAEATSAGAD